MFSWYHWIIIAIPVLVVCAFAIRCRRYVRSVTDFLVAGRCAGRYVLLSGGMMGGLAVVTFIGAVEQNYNTGFAMNFWTNLLMPLYIVLGFFGWVSYRFRETRAMSAGQFFEMRYSRGVRRLAAILRGSADMLANSIGPAVAVRFFIYLLGIPHRFTLFGLAIPTFPFLLAACLSLALLMILAGGRLSLLVTDAVQGLISYPIFVVMAAWVFTTFAWDGQIAAVMADRVPGESFLDPYDVSQIRDFNMFALVVTIFNSFFGNSFIGNGYGTVARSPHEAKMSGIIGNFGHGFAALLPVLFVLAVLTVMNHRDFAAEAHQIRQELSTRVADELSGDATLAEAAGAATAAVPVQVHEIGVDPPLSRAENLDTPTLEAVRDVFRGTMPEAEANTLFQGYRTTYLQQTLPVVMRHFFPPVLVALVAMLFLLLVVSTDDTRIFDSSTTWVQDFILPFFKKPPSPKTHLLVFKSVVVAVGVFFWFGSVFFSQIDYINMFVTIMCSIWMAGAGAVVTLGLYWRRGTTAGAYVSLVSGALLSLSGLLIQRNWAGGVLPWLASRGWDGTVRRALEVLSSPFDPWIRWAVTDAEWTAKFPINSTEIMFFSSVTAVLLYIVVSLIVCREPFNLERMLHRGRWADEPPDGKADTLHSAKGGPSFVGKADTLHSAKGGPSFEARPSFAKRMMAHLVGITPEYTRGDRIVTWGVFAYTIVYKFLIAFVGAVVASRAFRWGAKQWGDYFFVTTVAVPAVAGVVTSIWFTWGGIKDLRRLFRDLETRVRDDLDNGMVEGHVSLSDRAAFAAKDASHEALPGH